MSKTSHIGIFLVYWRYNLISQHLELRLVKEHSGVGFIGGAPLGCQETGYTEMLKNTLKREVHEEVNEEIYPVLNKKVMMLHIRKCYTPTLEPKLKQIITRVIITTLDELRYSQVDDNTYDSYFVFANHAYMLDEPDQSPNPTLWQDIFDIRNVKQHHLINFLEVSTFIYTKYQIEKDGHLS